MTDLASQRNIKEVGLFLEKEIIKAKKLDDNITTPETPKASSTNEKTEKT